MMDLGGGVHDGKHEVVTIMGFTWGFITNKVVNMIGSTLVGSN